MIRSRTVSPWLICIAFLLIGGCSIPDQVREYPVYRLGEESIIDGNVAGEAQWGTIPTDRAFVTPLIDELKTHLPAYKQTAFKIGYTDEHLFVAVVSREPWTRYLNKSPRMDPPFELDDGIQILLKPSVDGPVFTFSINAVGSHWAETSDGRSLSSDGWDARVSVSDTNYVTEIRIPLALLGASPVDGDVWSGNVVRNTRSITSPEDRITSWTAISGSVDALGSFGRLVFRDEVLTSQKLDQVEHVLAEESDEIMALEAASLARTQAHEDSLADVYRLKVEKTGIGLVGVTRGKADLIAPPGAPKGETWRYGLGFPMQIGPNRAALLTNIRMIGSGNIDFEIGTDVIVFDDLDDIRAENAIPISRYDRGIDPVHGDIIVRKGPVIAGFVPYGALLADGRPHPHAGTGFGIGWAISHKIDSEGKFEYTEFIERYAMQYQFAYDGNVFRVLEEKRIDASTLLPDWNLVGNFVTNGIPDGEDLLYVMIARADGVSVAGYTRWRRDSSGWHPVSFTPVTGFDVTWSEPSLIREADGNLLFSARSYDLAVPVQAFDIGVWRSVDNGVTWNRVIEAKNRRARSPISINRTVDGTPFIAANTPPFRRTREVLSIWPLDETRTRLEGRITARDAKAEFGPAPSGSWWRIDHPTSAVIRLADGNWHSVLSFRIVDNGEVEGNAPPAPQTGCYVEEVFSKGAASPMWRFE